MKNGFYVIVASIGKVWKQLLEFIYSMGKLPVTSVPIVVQNEVKIKMTKEEEFIKALPIAINEQFDPLIVYTHAYHETGNFKKLVGEYNYVGFKVPKLVKPPIAGWDGKTVDIITHEFTDGIKKEVIDKFCDFRSAVNFMTFYKFQIQRIYLEAYQNRKSPQAYFYWLRKKGFATDPTYDTKLEKLYAHLKANGKVEQIAKLI